MRTPLQHRQKVHSSGYLVCVHACRHIAAAEGAFSVVHWLVREGRASVNPLDRHGRTPLEVSQACIHADGTLCMCVCMCVCDKKGADASAGFTEHLSTS